MPDARAKAAAVRKQESYSIGGGEPATHSSRKSKMSSLSTDAQKKKVADKLWNAVIKDAA